MKIVGSDHETDPGAGVAAFADAVVDEMRVPAQRDAAARGAEIGFGADGVLLIAEVVGGVSESLDHGDAKIGRVRFRPAWARERPVDRASPDGKRRNLWRGS